MPSSHDQDEWLMAQVAAGQRALLEPLLRRYASPLLTFIRRMVGDAHRSEELFQEVFLQVWVKRAQYQFPRPFKPWLYRIALNKCRETFRVRVLPVFGEEGDREADDPSPSDAAIAVETAALVSAAVTRLPRPASAPSSCCASGTASPLPTLPRSSAVPKAPFARTCTMDSPPCERFSNHSYDFLPSPPLGRGFSPLSPLGRGAGGEGLCFTRHPPLTPNPSPQRGEGNQKETDHVSGTRRHPLPD